MRSGTDRETTFSGLKRVGFAIPLMFIGPMVIYSSFKNENHPLYYWVLGFGIIVCLYSMFLFYNGLQTMVSGFFNDKNK